MEIIEIRCSVCGVLYDRGMGGVQYVTNDQGERVICPHPIESFIIDGILGKHPSRYLMKQRTGMLRRWLCLSCLATCRLDFDRDDHRCAHCGSPDGKPVVDMLGKPCRTCRTGIIAAKPTGLVA
jgi:hypothetical protein